MACLLLSLVHILISFSTELIYQSLIDFDLLFDVLARHYIYNSMGVSICGSGIWNGHIYRAEYHEAGERCGVVGDH